MASPGLLATGCTHLPCGNSDRIEAFPIISPVLKWLGGEASKAVGDVWKAAMIGLWSAGLWLLKLAFKIIDEFTTPDLSASGPMGAVLPTTLWIGATVAVLMMFVQLTVALIRRDGQSMGRVLLGVVQFGLVWIAYLGVAAGLVAAAAGLEHGILSGMLHADSFSNLDLSNSWPRQVGDVVVATVLGVLSMLLVIPAAFFYVLIMFVREAALIILVATAPISASGLLADAGKVWFWKSLRWFIACLLISPMIALVLGIGVKLSSGVVSGAGDKTAAAAGMAVVGVVLIAIGCVCPLVLFRLMAFVDPGTGSGAALRQSWSDAGGLSGVVGGGNQTAGSSAATETASDGRSGGEANAESATQSRLASMLGPVGQGIHAATGLAHRAVDLGTDVLGAAGVGHPGYSSTPTDERSSRSRSGMSSPNGSTETGGETEADDTGVSKTPPPPPTPPHPPTPGGPAGPVPGGGGGAAGAGAGAAGGTEAAAVVIAL